MTKIHETLPASQKNSTHNSGIKSRPETIRKKQEILQAATEVFGQKGYTNASLAEIADKVGITRAGVLHHFDSKRNLLIETLRFRDMRGDHAQTTAPMPAGMEMFEHLIQTAFRNTSRAGIVQTYTVLSAEAVTDDSPGREYFLRRYAALREEISENFRALCEANNIEKDEKIEYAATSIVAVMDGIQSQWLMAPNSIKLGETTEFAIMTIVNAVLNQR